MALLLSRPGGLLFRLLRWGQARWPIDFDDPSAVGLCAGAEQRAER